MVDESPSQLLSPDPLRGPDQRIQNGSFKVTSPPHYPSTPFPHHSPDHWELTLTTSSPAFFRRLGFEKMLAKSMDQKVRWGVLGVADIAVKKVIPAMQRGECSQIVGIASRDLKKAQQAAEQLGIPKAYGSYEDLLADPEVEAIYNPLPNQLHVPWSIKAAEAGKHVLCEKPISLTVTKLFRYSRLVTAPGSKSRKLSWCALTRSGSEPWT